MPLINGRGETIQIETESLHFEEPERKDIPKVFLDGVLPTTKKDGNVTLRFRYASNTAEHSGFCTAKVQGDSSTRYPKKNFTLKLYKDSELEEKMKIDFKGWGSQSKFVIKANWIDILHVRNIGCARLWGDVVKSRQNYDSIPELMRTAPNQGAVDGFPVKVYNNGIYLGRYDWNIPKDAWMANMNDKNGIHCICASEDYNDYTDFVATPPCNGTDWTDEIHDVFPTALKTSFQAMANFIINSSDSEFVSGLDAYLDVESTIDAYCFISACALWDSVGKNQQFLTYDGTKWYQNMYDMDCAWGLWWTGVWAEESALQPFVRRNTNRLYNRLATLFSAEIKARYAELRTGALSEGHIISRMEQWTDICPPYLVAEDYAATTAEGAYVSMPLVTENNVQKLRERILHILGISDAWIDSL